MSVADDTAYVRYVFFFFFQAEDGIRDLTVTGVQTCALPICAVRRGSEPGRTLGREPRRRCAGSRSAQARAFTIPCSTALDAAPTTRSTTAPSLTNRIVGIARMPYWAASPGFWSTLTFISVTRPSDSPASP